MNIDNIENLNEINIIYDLKQEIIDLIIKIKSLFKIDFDIYHVTKSYNRKTDITSIKKKQLNYDIFPLEGSNNIFHKLENNGFIGYEKYQCSIKKINKISDNSLIIYKQNKEIRSVIPSYDNDIINYIEYSFSDDILKYKCNIIINDYYKNGMDHNKKVIIKIPMKENYLDQEKMEYINDIKNKIEILLNE